MRGVKSKVLHKEVIEKYRVMQDVGAPSSRPSCLATPSLESQSSVRARYKDDQDMPMSGLENPYEKEAPRCILCQKDVQLDYKNTRLLSQFVSSHTGRIYGRQITGLCLFMQKRVAKLIKRSQFFGFMPYELKDPHFLKDPKLFDPFKRK